MQLHGFDSGPAHADGAGFIKDVQAGGEVHLDTQGGADLPSSPSSPDSLLNTANKRTACARQQPMARGKRNIPRLPMVPPSVQIPGVGVAATPLGQTQVGAIPTLSSTALSTPGQGYFGSPGQYPGISLPPGAPAPAVGGSGVGEKAASNSVREGGHPTRQSAKVHEFVTRPSIPRSKEDIERFETMAQLQRSKKKEKPGPKPKIKTDEVDPGDEANLLKKRKREGLSKTSIENEKEKELKRQNDTLDALAARASGVVSHTTC